MLRFVVGLDSGDNWSWWLYGENTQLLAWAGESFSSSSNARRAMTAFKVGASTARYEVYLDLANEWRWRAWRSSDKVAASGRTFDSYIAAHSASVVVRDYAGRGDEGAA